MSIVSSSTASLPDRSCPTDQFKIQPILETLQTLLHLDGCFRRSDYCEFEEDEFDEYWSEVSGCLRKMRDRLPIDLDLVQVNEDVREGLRELDDLIQKVWHHARLEDATVDYLMSPMLVVDVDCLQTIERLLGSNGQPASITPEPDGPFKPDGFRLNGIPVLGLVKDWQTVLTFVWKRTAEPPKWQDVATHLGVLGEMEAHDFRKLIYKINRKLKEHWPETLQTVQRGLVVLRPPIRGQSKANGSSAIKLVTKKTLPKPKRLSLSKKVSVTNSTRNKRATRR